MTQDDVTRDMLPVPDYDHLPVGSFGHRIRSLAAEDLELLRRYEQAHANRPLVLRILDQRLLGLAEGDHPSGGDAAAAPAEPTGAPDTAGAVSPQTAGPALNPPSHGVPTNPAQPR